MRVATAHLVRASAAVSPVCSVLSASVMAATVGVGDGSVVLPVRLFTICCV